MEVFLISLTEEAALFTSTAARVGLEEEFVAKELTCHETKSVNNYGKTWKF